MTDATPIESEKRPQRLDEKFQTFVRWARRIATVAMVVIAGVIVRVYDFERLDDAQFEALDGRDRLGRGAFLVFSKVDDDTLLGVGSLVEAMVKVPPLLVERIGKAEGGLLTEIGGMPGMVISFAPQSDGSVELLLDGKRTYATMRLEWQMGIPHHVQVREGPIPEGHFLLLNPNVEASLDSRQVGLVARSQLQRKAGHL